MVVSEAARAWMHKDKAPAVNTSTPLEVQDASESSWANPRSASPPLPEREAYVTVDALKNFMSTMTDTITRQVSEQVKRVVDVAKSARLLPHFDYTPTHRGEPFHLPE